jgi:peroxiredoxin Q/BCP
VAKTPALLIALLCSLGVQPMSAASAAPLDPQRSLLCENVRPSHAQESTHPMSTQQQTSPLKVGDKAPKFSLKAHPSGTISLDDFAGKKNVILAFYPKDDTPGCTKEMCAFSDDLNKFQSTDTEVLGISLDDVESHGKFAAKHNLTQKLLADTDKQASRAYGVLKADKDYTERVLFIIDKNGVIQYVHEGMPSNAELLDTLKTLK